MPELLEQAWLAHAVHVRGFSDTLKYWPLIPASWGVGGEQIPPGMSGFSLDSGKKISGKGRESWVLYCNTECGL